MRSGRIQLVGWLTARFYRFPSSRNPGTTVGTTESGEATPPLCSPVLIRAASPARNRLLFIM